VVASKAGIRIEAGVLTNISNSLFTIRKPWSTDSTGSGDNGARPSCLVSLVELSRAITAGKAVLKCSVLTEESFGLSESAKRGRQMYSMHMSYSSSRLKSTSSQEYTAPMPESNT